MEDLGLRNIITKSRKLLMMMIIAGDQEIINFLPPHLPFNDSGAHSVNMSWPSFAATEYDEEGDDFNDHHPHSQ